MRGPREFARSVFWVEVSAIAGLLLAGIVLTLCESGYAGGGSFFSYRVRHLDGLPAWFAATLALMAANGFWLFRLAQIEGAFRTPRGTRWGDYSASLPLNPLRLFAVNLVAIPTALGLFVVVRANYW